MRGQLEAAGLALALSNIAGALVAGLVEGLKFMIWPQLEARSLSLFFNSVFYSAVHLLTFGFVITTMICIPVVFFFKDQTRTICQTALLVGLLPLVPLVAAPAIWEPAIAVYALAAALVFVFFYSKLMPDRV